VLDTLDFHVEVFLLLQQLPQMVLILKLVRDEGVKFLCGVVLDELD
jgi:hypothetical protein